MQTGQFILDRLMVGIIKDICEQRGVTFSSFSDDWVLELSKDGITKRVLGYKFSLNDAVASSISGDKVAAHILLERAGLPSVKHVLLRPKVSEMQKEPLRQWENIVVKPLDGSGGYGVKLFSDLDKLVEWIESTGYPAWAASPMVMAEREIRIVLLDGEPLIVFEKEGVEIDGLKMFNLGQGAAPKEYTPDREILELAVKAQVALGLRLSAIDILETAEGERVILEVNSGFMLENYMRYSPENRERAVQAYTKIIDAVMQPS